MRAKPEVGRPFPEITAMGAGGERVTLARPAGRWHLVIVYRGAHCPRCATYLAKLVGHAPKLRELGVEVTLVSSDPRARAEKFLADSGVDLPLAAELTIDDARALGLYISDPRDANETDQPFPEPGLFVIRPDGIVQVADISNSASFRPDLDVALSGITSMVERGIPIRGLA